MLAGAVVLLALGLTLLKGRLGPLGFVVYWLGCLALTCLAMITALLDLRAFRDRSRQDQERLMQNTIEKIRTDVRRRRPGDRGKSREGA